ncbi:MAG: two-component regulator propeller domain-containing protein [Ignavibacteriaceae bacterium]
MVRIKIFFLLQLFVLKVILPQTFPNHHFTVKEGLPNSHIISFTQDEKGFIWLSTPNAVSRFDGHNFTNYFVSDENAIIDKIQIVKGKVIYLINKKGIYSFNRSTFDAIYTEKNKEFVFNKWLQRNDTLFLFSDQSIHLVNKHKLIDSIKIHSSNSQPKSVSKILSVFMDINNRILIGTNKGLFIYKKRTLKIISPDIKIPVYCITEDPEGDLWIGSDDKILKIGSDGNIIRQIKLCINKTYPVEKLLVDRFSNIWFSIKNYSLFVLSDNKLIQIGKNLGLDKSQINFITKDTDENIWVGTCYKGLYCFHDIYIYNYNEDDVLSNEFDSYLTLHNNKSFATGSSSLLDLLEKNIIRNLNKRQHVFIKEIKKGNDNKIFVACISDKTGVIDIITSNNSVYYFIGASAIFPDKNNVLITGDWENNLRFYDLTKKGFPIIKKIQLFEKKEKINKIYRDKSDNLWVASVSGLCVIGNKSIKYFKDFELLNCSVNDINIDNNNIIWFASDKGLGKFDGTKWQWYENYNDYNLRSSSNITFDSEGGIWISNSKGLVRFKNKTINYWDNNSGLVANEIYFLNYDNINNHIWVGTNNGISKFDIDKFNLVKFKPLNIYLEKVSIDDSVLQNYNNIRLDEDNSIRIDFASTNYINPNNITYQYKFEGLENHWNETENPFVDFASLSPGNYNLLIRAGTVNKGRSSKKINVQKKLRTRCQH